MKDKQLISMVLSRIESLVSDIYERSFTGEIDSSINKADVMTIISVLGDCYVSLKNEFYYEGE